MRQQPVARHNPMPPQPINNSALDGGGAPSAGPEQDKKPSGFGSGSSGSAGSVGINSALTGRVASL